MVGCRVGAKNTLVKNYLALAERRGVTIEPLRTVTRVRPLDPAAPEQGYAVTTVRSGSWGRRRAGERTVTAGAGRRRGGGLGHGPAAPRDEGRARGAGAAAPVGHARGADPDELRGPRWGDDGPGARGRRPDAGVSPSRRASTSPTRRTSRTAATARVPTSWGRSPSCRSTAADGIPRWVRFAGTVARHPLGLRPVAVDPALERAHRHRPRHADAATTRSRCARRRGLLGWHLTSTQGHGEPNPTYIPEGNVAVRAMAARLERTTGERAWPGVVGRRGPRHPDDGALPRRRGHLRLARARRHRPLPAGVGLPRPARARRVGRLGQPRRQPEPDHHGAGRAGRVAVARARRGGPAAGPGRGLPSSSTPDAATGRAALSRWASGAG